MICAFLYTDSTFQRHNIEKLERDGIILPLSICSTKYLISEEVFYWNEKLSLYDGLFRISINNLTYKTLLITKSKSSEMFMNSLSP